MPHNPTKCPNPRIKSGSTNSAQYCCEACEIANRSSEYWKGIAIGKIADLEKRIHILENSGKAE